jgi:hypothetical protein
MIIAIGIDVLEIRRMRYLAHRGPWCASRWHRPERVREPRHWQSPDPGSIPPMEIRDGIGVVAPTCKAR